MDFLVVDKGVDEDNDHSGEDLRFKSRDSQKKHNWHLKLLGS